MRQLLFNYNVSDITPTEPLLLGGFANRKGLSSGIHRRLTSRCIVLKQENLIVCIIVNDFMDIDPKIVSSIKKRITEKTGIPDSSVIIASIHTHSAPDLNPGISDANDRYIEFIVKKISEGAAGVIADSEGFREAVVTSGKAVCDINIARRDVWPEDGGRPFRIGDPDGLRDNEVGVLQLKDKSGLKKVTFINYSCHPVTLGYESRCISTDYPGRAREVTEEGMGGMAVFLNGATGDINPRQAHHTDTSLTDKTGEQLGTAVLSAEMGAENDCPELKYISKCINIPFRDQNITKEHIREESIRKASDRTEFFTWQEMLDRWEEKICEMIGNNEVKTYLPVRINVLKLGETVFFFTQGELFVKYQIELKKMFSGNQIFCIAYTHGVGSYIPTSDAFEKKGYETDQAYIYELLPSPLSPEVEGIFIREAAAAISEVTGEGRSDICI